MTPGEEDEEPEEMKEAAETLNKKHDLEDPEALDANGNPIRRRKQACAKLTEASLTKFCNSTQLFFSS